MIGMKNPDVAKAAARKAWKTRRKGEKEQGDLFSIEKQTAIKARIEKNRRRDAAIAAGPDAYQEYLRTEEGAKEGASPERVLILVPPKLLDKFRQFCNEESYSFVEGIREAMRRMLVEHEFETPDEQAKSFEALGKSLQALSQQNQDPSTLPSQQKNTL